MSVWAHLWRGDTGPVSGFVIMATMERGVNTYVRSAHTPATSQASQQLNIMDFPHSGTVWMGREYTASQPDLHIDDSVKGSSSVYNLEEQPQNK